jgi:hypothetical protein
MSQYHHHPDNLIYVRTEKGIYCDTIANFAIDFGQIWPLPDCVSELLYEDGPKSRHVVFDAAGNQFASGFVPFPFGDAAIAAIDALLAAQVKRDAPPPPPEPVQAPLPRKARSPSIGTNKV